MQDWVGQQVSNYRLVKLLGYGGFGEVYLGEHNSLKSYAAIKVLSTQLKGNEVNAFLKEAQTIARLDHPHIVRVLDFVVQMGTPFLIINYLPNGTLRNHYPAGARLPLATVVSYVKEAADALQYAHDEKVIHRDIKPENMLLGRRSELVLTDFGIATVAHSSRYQNTQDIAGTIAYMAPEQIQGYPRPSSDQYSLGIVVYEWLTGERPFRGSWIEVATQHLTINPRPLREKVPEIPPAIEHVVLTALSKDPKQRFDNIQSFATALEQASLSPQSSKASVSELEPATKLVSTTYQSPPMVAPSPQLSDLNAMYRESIKARAQGDLERTALLWQQILDRDSQFQSGTLAAQLKKLLEELTPWRIKRLSDQAEQARAAGAWGQEIGHLQALLKLMPDDDETNASIALAEQHQRYAWMYEVAAQFVAENALSEAKTQLEMLWQEDPDYGDPAILAEKVGIKFPSLLKESYRGTYQWGDTSKHRIELDSISQRGTVIKGHLCYNSDKAHIYSFEGKIDGKGELAFSTTGKTRYDFTGKVHSDGHLRGSVELYGSPGSGKGTWDVSDTTIFNDRDVFV